MKRLALAMIAAALACIAVVPALTAGQTAAPDPTPLTCDSSSAGQHYKDARKTIDAGWNWRNWKSGPKQAQLRNVQSHINCLERKRDRDKIKDYLGKKQVALQSYREYRQITPYRCQGGKYGTWSIPCYIIACESGFSWSAYNPSGASGPYQLLGWGAPMPANTWERKMEHHRIAASLALSNWVCA